MRRVIVLGAIVAAGTLSYAVSQAAQQPAAAQQPKVVEVEKLKDNLYVLKGGGGNTAVFVQANGITVVDTKNPGWGAPILAKIKELSPKPVTTIINTHTHGDHVSGNVEFPATVDIVVQENTKANMEKMDAFKGDNAKYLPKKTYKDKLSLGSGKDRVDLYYFGRGHTNGDTWIVYPSLRVMQTGDMFAWKDAPVLDRNNGGSGVAIPDSLAKAFASIKNVETIITGHSTVMTMSDLKEYADFNREFMMAVQEGKKAGKSVDDIANNWKMPAKYKGYAMPQAARLKANVQVIFDELK